MEVETNENHESVPPRSVLHSLRPLGLGTPFVESAESYLRRLTASHVVERSKLHHFINHYGDPIYGDLRGQPARVDTPTANAAAYMRRTAELTRQPAVALLGLGWLAGCATSQNCLRKRRAWCGLCFLEMQAHRQELSVPMLWSFAFRSRSRTRHFLAPARSAAAIFFRLWSCVLKGVPGPDVTPALRRDTRPRSPWRDHRDSRIGASSPVAPQPGQVLRPGRR